MAMNTGADRPEPGSGPGPADGAAHDDERLACGRMLSEVWASWEDGTDGTDGRDSTDGTDDPHLSTCPHCAQAVQQVNLLGEAVLGTRGEQDPDWDTSRLTERVMEMVRLELRPGRSLPLGEPDEDLWVREAMAAKGLRAAAETVPGVQAGSCRIRPAAQDGTSAARGPVQVTLEVVVPLTARLQGLAEEIRGRVSAAADAVLGLPVETVDIRITDVTDPVTDPVTESSEPPGKAADITGSVPDRRGLRGRSRHGDEETNEGEQL